MSDEPLEKRKAERRREVEGRLRSGTLWHEGHDWQVDPFSHNYILGAALEA